jgi:hypothetical protein
LMRSLSTVSFAGVYGGKPNEYEDFLT